MFICAFFCQSSCVYCRVYCSSMWHSCGQGDHWKQAYQIEPSYTCLCQHLPMFVIKFSHSLMAARACRNSIDGTQNRRLSWTHNCGSAVLNWALFVKLLLVHKSSIKHIPSNTTLACQQSHTIHGEWWSHVYQIRAGPQLTTDYISVVLSRWASASGSQVVGGYRATIHRGFKQGSLHVW